MRARIAIVVSSLIVAIACLFPFAWMAVSSFKTAGELYAVPPVWWPSAPTLDNYRRVLFASNGPRYFLNSLVISAGSTTAMLPCPSHDPPLPGMTLRTCCKKLLTEKASLSIKRRR